MKDKYVTQTIRIREDQRNWANKRRKNHEFNLSKFIRDKLDEIIPYFKEDDKKKIN